MHGKLKRTTHIQLELFILLVYFSYKEAYLVDCCMLTYVEACGVIKAVVLKYGLQPHRLRIVLVQDDIFVLNNDSIHKLIEDKPFVVDISHENCSLIPEHVVSLILQELKVSLDNTSLENYILSSSSASAPLLAGWLLGYPCLYQSKGSTDEHSSDTSLSMIELCKISFKADVSIFTGQDKLRVLSSSHQAVEILGFSVPQDLLVANPTVEVSIQCKLDAMLDRLISLSAQQINAVALPLVVSNLRLERTTAMVPSIVL